MSLEYMCVLYMDKSYSLTIFIKTEAAASRLAETS